MDEFTGSHALRAMYGVVLKQQGQPQEDRGLQDLQNFLRQAKEATETELFYWPEYSALWATHLFIANRSARNMLMEDMYALIETSYDRLTKYIESATVDPVEADWLCTFCARLHRESLAREDRGYRGFAA